MNERWWVVGVVVVALTVMGCASSGGADAVPATTATTVPAGAGASGPGSTDAPPAPGSYDTAGHDVAAICTQLLVIAERWDAPASPPPSTPDQQATVSRQLLREMRAASDRLAEIAPAGLADDVGGQVDTADAMYARMFPDVTSTSTTTGPGIDLAETQGQQDRLEAFATASCGFSIWDYAP